MTRLELAARGLVMPALTTCAAVSAQRGSVWLVLVCGFLISYIWSGNVRALAAACATWSHRVAYASGASIGSVLGMAVGRWVA